MGEFMSQEEDPVRLLFVCTYCDKHRNDDGYWEQAYGFDECIYEGRISHGICPKCLKEHFPDEYSSLRKEGKIAIKEKIMPDSRVLYGCFFVVNNMGYLYGDYDREQRI
jgi:hypothetical protein